MDIKTPNLGLFLIKPNQLQREIIINEAFVSFDGLINNSVQSITTTILPAEPQLGDLYAVPDNSTQKWLQKENHLALFNNGWRYFKLNDGYISWIKDQKKLMIFLNDKWLTILDNLNNY
jgi:hypothetical protein